MQPAGEAPLVATKLFVPRLRPKRVDRTRLRDRLDASRHTVPGSAPAGSGKSTLLADGSDSPVPVFDTTAIHARGGDHGVHLLESVLPHH